MRHILLKVIIFALTFLLLSCNKKKTKIGFSQCTSGEWREQMNNEMRAEVNFYENVELEIINANGDVNQQIEDILYFIDQNVDLLIISPFEDKSLQDQFNKIDFKGIPILLVDRYIQTNKHTSFVGASNIEAGRISANYLLEHLDMSRPVKILHIRGYENSSATKDREEAFTEIFRPYQNVEIIILNAGNDLDGWTLNNTKRIVRENNHLLAQVDAVYGFSDAMTLVASREAEEMKIRKNIIFVGIDGQIGYGRGLDAVKKNNLQATVVYPPGGDVAIETAMQIINKIPVQKTIPLPLTLVSKENIDSYYLQETYIQNYQNKIKLLHYKTDKELYYAQIKMKIAIISAIIISLLVFILFYSLYRRKVKQIDENNHARNLTNLKEESSSSSSPVSMKDSLLKDKIESILEKKYANENFTVDTLSKQLGLSRMHLYRKFKDIYGDTPNNFIRKYRLHKAKQMIDEGNFYFSEIAYKVGFTSPSYFSKCFKEAFRLTPSEYIDNRKLTNNQQ